jgi:hypothetical protein
MVSVYKLKGGKIKILTEGAKAAEEFPKTANGESSIYNFVIFVG